MKLEANSWNASAIVTVMKYEWYEVALRAVGSVTRKAASVTLLQLFRRLWTHAEGGSQQVYMTLYIAIARTDLLKKISWLRRMLRG